MEADVLVLDEPDVFLHADFQRRLVGLLESVPAQTITATHSAEVVAEADPGKVLWVSRDRKRALRAPDDRLLQEMSEALGTHFNLRMARALRTRCVVFVEGQDMKVLRQLAGTLQAVRVQREDGVATIPLVGFDRWEHVAPFTWLTSELLNKSVPVYVVLDRDYRDEDAVARIEDELRGAGVTPHVWERHELENYLLSVSAIARVAKLPEEDVEALLGEVVAGFEAEFYAQISAYETRSGRRARRSDTEIGLRVKQRADSIWNGPKRIDACPGKDLLAALNLRLQGAGHNAVTVRHLAPRLRADEIPSEVRALIHQIDDAAGR
jgi:predicted ATP-dependent endonuclease of OLD family